MRDGPLISIVTPSYNQGHFLEETIRSIINQSYPQIEHIIVDGGSTDGTVDLLRQYEGLYPMRWVSEPDGGQADAVNKGVRMAQGDLIGWLNSDDIYVVTDTLAQLARTFQQYPEGRVFYGDCQVIDERSQLRLLMRQHQRNLTTLMLGTSLAQPSIFFHRDVFTEVGYLDTSLHYALDWSFTVRLLSHYPPEQVIYMPLRVASSREYGKTKSLTGGKRVTQERRRFLSSFYQRRDLSPLLYALETKAFMSTYWREAYLECRSGQYGSCLLAAWQAVRLDPWSLINRVPIKAYRLALGRR